MTREQVYDSALQYFGGDKLAADVWVDKYAMKDKEGVYYESTPDDMHKRISKELARIENKYKDPIPEEKIYDLLKGFKYVVPQGSPMAGIGNDFTLISLSNCFVIGSNKDSDSYGSIMRTDEEQAQIMKRRGGVGHDLSHLRPNGSLANNSVLKGLAGSVAYAERYSNTTKEVSQGGRRGALMLTMNIGHPDAENFIDSKLDLGKITGANISVKITDEFMKAVYGDEDFIQTFPVGLNWQNHIAFTESLINDQIEYDKLYGLEYKGGYSFKGCYAKRVKARKIWDKIIKNAWKSAEPGVLFWDKVQSESPADVYGKEWETISTNPCGELPLCEYDSCRLLLLNLYSYVKDPFTKQASFDFELLSEHSYIAQKLMDDIIDLEIEKIDAILAKIESDPEIYDIKSVESSLWKRIRDKAVRGRRTGLGVTAEGDALAALGLQYGSENSINIAEEIHKTIAVNSYKSSIDMADERGSIPMFDPELEKNSLFIDRILKELPKEYVEKYMNVGRRNIANLTIAPAGSVSILTQTTSGIEPVFQVYYKRRKRATIKERVTFIDENGEWFEDYIVFHHKFIDWYEKNWYKTSSQLFDLDFNKPLEQYTEEELKVLISKSPYNKSTSEDIDWNSKVKLQGAVQKWVDHSISATTNVPEKTSVSTVSDIYFTAYESGCKGMTIYRDGSRSGVLVSADEKDEIKYVDAVKRPKELVCDIYHKTALKKDWTILVGLHKGKPYEIFAFPVVDNTSFPYRLTKGSIIKVKSKTYKLVGKDGDKVYELPNIIDLIDITGQVDTRKYSLMLRHHIDPKWIIREIEEFANITSFDKVIQRVLRNYSEAVQVLCEVCGSPMKIENGCHTCTNCSYSKCD